MTAADRALWSRRPIAAQARHRLWISGAVLIILAGTLAVTTGRDHERPPDATARVVVGAVGSSATGPEGELPVGTSERGGYPVGFPHTPQGAAALAVELSRSQVGLDRATARAAIGVYTDASDRDYFDGLVASSLATRMRLVGLAAGARVSEVPAPVTYAQTPLGYQVNPMGPDRYHVAVLSELTIVDARGRQRQSLYVGEQIVGWQADVGDRGDWRVQQPTPADLQQLAEVPPPDPAPLGSDEFEAAGWTALLSPVPEPGGAQP